MSIGPLALVGGDELHPGNEPQDRLLVDAARGGPAFVVTTAAARQHPERAAENARRWFAELGLEIEELPLTTRSRARSPELAARARAGRFFYLVGGDPGLVPRCSPEPPRGGRSSRRGGAVPCSRDHRRGRWRSGSGR
jgi:hypothetical protein